MQEIRLMYRNGVLCLQISKLSSRVEPGSIAQDCSTAKHFWSGCLPKTPPPITREASFPAKNLGAERQNHCIGREILISFCVTLARGSMLEAAEFSGRGRQQLAWDRTAWKTKVCRRGGSLPVPIAARRECSWRSTWLTSAGLFLQEKENSTSRRSSFHPIIPAISLSEQLQQNCLYIPYNNCHETFLLLWSNKAPMGHGTGGLIL